MRNESRRAELPGIDFVSCLTSFWSNNPRLKRLSLERCYIGSEGFEILTNALLNRQYTDTLKYLDLSHNVFDEDDIDLSGLTRALAKCKRLYSLVLSSNNIGVKGCTSLVGLLVNQNCNLTKLYLDRNYLLRPDSLVLFVDSLTKNSKLDQLDLDRTWVDRFDTYETSQDCLNSWKSMMKLVCVISQVSTI